jgi:hypothetical protein
MQAATALADSDAESREAAELAAWIQRQRGGL